MRATPWVLLAASGGLLIATGIYLGFGSDTAAPADDPTILHGQEVARACAVCHAIRRSDPPRVGPSLSGIVGAPKARLDGFGYSAALAAAGGVWDEAALDAFLHDPQGYLPGTAMTFEGLPDAADRAAVIAYLGTDPR